jgi:myo-inositol-1(or 4)-monophosphatase
MKKPDIESFLIRLGRFQLQGYRADRVIETRRKKDRESGASIVTAYDVESEERTVRFLHRHFPGDSFLGEELGDLRRDPARYWVMDPIDGTTNFTQGIAYWGPSLALYEKGRLAEGWIYLPALGELFHARRGKGATLNGRRIRTITSRRYDPLLTVATTSRFHRHLRLLVPSKERILGSLVANLAYVASGTFVAAFCQGHLWDVAAGVLIAREAGAVVHAEPDVDHLRLGELELEEAPSITVHATANSDLPLIEGRTRRISRPVRIGRTP